MAAYPSLVRAISAPTLMMLLASLATAAPGPDEAAESQTFDVTLRARSGTEYSGPFTFVGDSNRPQRVEVGDLEFELTDVVEETSFTMGSGMWISFEFFFGEWWFALGQTDLGGRVFTMGIARGERIAGKAYVYGDENIDNGRYRLSGQLSEDEAEPAPE